MTFLAPIALFMLGAVVASFIGVIVSRFNTGQSFLFGRSVCDACGNPLSLPDLVPLFSYLLLGARARCCGSYLSPHAPLTELLLGALFALSYYTIGFSYALPFFLLSLSLLLALVLYDIAHQILPSSLLLLFVGASAIAGYLLSPTLDTFARAMVIAVVFALLLAAIHFLSRGKAMGLADAPLTFGLALLAGPAAPAGFLFSFWIGALIGIVILLRRSAGSRIMVEVPFAPFLAAGFLLAYFTQWDPLSFIAVSPLLSWW